MSGASAVVIVLDEHRAVALTAKIRCGIEDVWVLIEQAYHGRAWVVMGYASWDDYITSEFGDGLPGLPRERRCEVVASMRAAGMSQRAIASATGTSQMTVQRELSTEPNDSVGEPEPEVVGVNGKHYAPPSARPKPTTRSGASPWSRRIQRVSSAVPMDDLTDDEVTELLGAATFLRDYCKGELITRGVEL